jgi:hypothetical protein
VGIRYAPHLGASWILLPNKDTITGCDSPVPLFKGAEGGDDWGQFQRGCEEVIIIDSGSTASSPDFVRQKFPSVRLSALRRITARMNSSLQEEFFVV